MRFERSRKHMIDFIFPLTLLLVFAVSALIVLLLSARIYAAQTEQADKNYQTTTPLSYITEKFRANDTYGVVSVEKREGRECLAFHMPADTSADNNGNTDTTGYTTYLYTDGGWLKELVVRDDADAYLKAGKKVIEARDLTVTRKKNGLYRIMITEKNGTQVSRLLAERSHS